MTTVCAQAAPKKAADPAELMAQAEAAFAQYNPETAREHLQAALTALKKVKKPDAHLLQRIEALQLRVNRMEEMMQRVETITVIDSINAPTDEFFEFYRLSSEAGSFAPSSILPEEFSRRDSGVVYIPQNGRSLIWSSPDGLLTCQRFTDGRWDSPTELGSVFESEADYPFLMADGVTLYFANRGEDTLGGLDIYISRKNDSGEFLTPQNVGMPYNSPYNDFLLAIDEETGAGWWATDRNQIPDSVTIYVFIPSEMRVNYPVDAPDLADMASMRGWQRTLRGHESEAEALQQRLEHAGDTDADQSSEFSFSFPDGKIYTSLDNFKNPSARSLMEQYLDAQNEDEADRRLLGVLRAGYKPNNVKAAERIGELERKLKQTRRTLRGMANQIVKLEMPEAR